MVRLRKALRLMVLLVVVVVAYVSLFTRSPISINENTRQAIFLNFKLMYSKLTTESLSLDENPNFQEKAREITAEKLSIDSSSSLYFLLPEYVPPTEISIPQYFLSSEEKQQKPLLQPFDPRFTLSVYYTWIRENPGKTVPFHWSDWVDLFILNKFILLPSGKKETCQSLFQLSDEQKAKSDTSPLEDYCENDPSFPLGYKVIRYPLEQTRENAQLLGKSHLFSACPPPARLVFLTNNHGAYHIDVENSENDLKYALLRNGLPEQVILSQEIGNLDVVSSYKSLIKTQKPAVEYQDEPAKINIEESAFDVNVDDIIQLLKKEDITLQEKKYLSSLEYSKGTQLPGKSLMEAKLITLDEQKLLGDHFDWRFFNGLTLGTDKQVLALHRVLKNYLSFCRAHGIVTWIAHGSLLSWYWNGMAFPWDADTDVQMPIKDLHYLAREFNQTLIIENTGHDLRGADQDNMDFNGMGAFFIDVGASITHRDHGNGLNNIDARFIDVSSGLYVDITGLAVSNEQAPERYDYPKILPKPKSNEVTNKLKQLFNCRNKHFVSLNELTPLIKTVVQNEVAYIPQNFSPLLEHEYRAGGMIQQNFKDYMYLSSLRLWVKTQILLDYAKEPAKWMQTSRGTNKRDLQRQNLRVVAKFDEDDFANLLHDDWILREYLTGREFTRFHEEQMKYLLSSRMDSYFARLQNYMESGHVNRPIWGDTFMHSIAVEGWDYNKQVEKLNVLISLYDEEPKPSEETDKDEV